MTEQTEPRPDEEFHDCAGRKLWVDEVVVGDPSGREVRGRVRKARVPPREGTDYACTLAHWAAVWRDQAPRWEGST